MDTTIERVALGRTDVQLTPMGVGAWSWGDKLVWGYGQGYNDEDVRAAYTTTLDLGINWFDTAEMYGFGQSERLLGRFMSEAGGPRPLVATKYFPLPWRILRQDVVKALRGSLRRLNLTQVDLYQIHWPTPIVPIERLMDGLAEAVHAGLARAVGVSNYDAAQMRRAHAALARHGVPLASNQVEYSLLQRAPERNGVLDTCRELGISLIAYSPLAMGALTGKYTADNPPKGARGRTYNAQRLAQVAPLINLLRTTGERYGKTPAQVALNWTMGKGTLPIPGAKNARQARDNAGALGWRLTPDEIAALDEASAAL